MMLPAEFVGMATHTADGILSIGDGTDPVEIYLSRGEKPGWLCDRKVAVYVRRDSKDLSVIEVTIARHDGIAEEALQAQNMEAQRYPAGAKEYWRSHMVGKDLYGPDRHLMTGEDFEEYWDEPEAGETS